MAKTFLGTVDKRAKLGVYEVEYEVFDHDSPLLFAGTLTPGEQQALTHQLCAHFGVTPADVRTNNRGRSGFQPLSISRSGSWSGITYRTDAGTAVVCHETAHYLHFLQNDRKTVRPYDSHGPEWQALYVGCVQAILGNALADTLAAGYATFEAEFPEVQS